MSDVNVRRRTCLLQPTSFRHDLEIASMVLGLVETNLSFWRVTDSVPGCLWRPCHQATMIYLHMKQVLIILSSLWFCPSREVGPMSKKESRVSKQEAQADCGHRARSFAKPLRHRYCNRVSDSVNNVISMPLVRFAYRRQNEASKPQLFHFATQAQ